VLVELSLVELSMADQRYEAVLAALFGQPPDFSFRPAEGLGSPPVSSTPTTRFGATRVTGRDVTRPMSSRLEGCSDRLEKKALHAPW
jgi:hypothetical protein